MTGRFLNNVVLKPLLSGASKAGIWWVGGAKKGKEGLPIEEAAAVMGNEVYTGALTIKDNRNRVFRCQRRELQIREKTRMNT